MILNYNRLWFEVGIEVKVSPQPSDLHLSAVEG